MAPLLLSTCNIHWVARPHVLSWLFLLWAMFPRRAGVAETAAVTVLWANVHPSFWLGCLRGAGRGPAYLVRVCAIVLLVPLLNPYGFHLYSHVWRYLTDADLLS